MDKYKNNAFMSRLMILETTIDRMCENAMEIDKIVFKYTIDLNALIYEGMKNWATTATPIINEEAYDVLKGMLLGTLSFSEEKVYKIHEFLPDLYKVLKKVESISELDEKVILKTINPYR